MPRTGTLVVLRLTLSSLLAFGAGALRVAHANVSRPASPFKLNLCLTYRCQYRCKTCNIWQRQPVDEMTTDELLTFVRKNRQVSWLDLTGGEIFLRPDIEEILLAITTSWKRLLLLHFPTNGFLTDRIVRAVSRLTGKGTARVIVTVSLDGDERLNDDIRGIRGGYQRQLETFRALRAIPGSRVVLGMTLSRYNAGHFEETFHACQRDCPGLTIDDFHLNVAQLSDHYYGNQNTSAPIVPQPGEARAELSLYRSMRGVPRSLAAWLEDEYPEATRFVSGNGPDAVALPFTAVQLLHRSVGDGVSVYHVLPARWQSAGIRNGPREQSGGAPKPGGFSERSGTATAHNAGRLVRPIRPSSEIWADAVSYPNRSVAHGHSQRFLK